MPFHRTHSEATLLVTVSTLLAACAGPMDTRLPPAPQHVQVGTVPEVFGIAGVVHEGTTPQLPMSPGQVPRTMLAGKELNVIPVVLDAARPHTLVVRSFVVRAPDGSRVLFYPLVSVFDERFQLQQTLKPKYEFAFDNGLLRNEFEIPAGAGRLLVHTDESYYKGAFVGQTMAGVSGPSGHSGDRTIGGLSRSGLYGVAGALGGVVGVAIAIAASSDGGSSGGGARSGPPVGAGEFRLGEVGLVQIEAD